MNVMDVNIIDLNGEKYDINSISVDGNDVINILIKKTDEAYISNNRGRLFIKEVLGGIKNE